MTYCALCTTVSVYSYTLCLLLLWFKFRKSNLSIKLVDFVISRWQISSTFGFFLLFKRNEIAVIQKIQITGRDSVLTWNTGHINAMGCTRTHIYDVSETTSSKYVYGAWGKWNSCSALIAFYELFFWLSVHQVLSQYVHCLCADISRYIFFHERAFSINKFAETLWENVRSEKKHYFNIQNSCNWFICSLGREGSTFLCYTSIVIYGWHQFLLFPFCFQCLCSDLWRMDLFGIEHLTPWVQNAKTIGGQHWSTYKTMWTQRIS